MKKKILIIGGTGVISYAVVLESLKQGYHVSCINRGKNKMQVLPNEVELLIGDYKNKEKMESLLENLHFDVVVDVLCFSLFDIDYSISLFKDKCDQYIFFSSCAVYNKGLGDYECNEDSEKINSVWDYSINKWRCEEYLTVLAQKFHFNYTIVRPAVTYGNTRIPYGITPPYGYHGTLIQRMIYNKPIIVWDNGDAYSTITRVEDFAVGLVGLFANEEAYNQAFHIAGDERYKWSELLEIMGEILNVKPIFFNLSKEEYAFECSSKRGEILGGRGISQLLDNSKIKKIVPNFKTNITLKEGLSQTISYYENHDYLKGIDWRFDADIDRIIAKYCKLKKLPIENLNLRFIDYLGTATYIDRVKYWFEFHKEFVPVIICRKIFTFILKLKKILH